MKNLNHTRKSKLQMKVIHEKEKCDSFIVAATGKKQLTKKELYQMVIELKLQVEKLFEISERLLSLIELNQSQLNSLYKKTCDGKN